jgi:hypothetical protein
MKIGIAMRLATTCRNRDAIHAVGRMWRAPSNPYLKARLRQEELSSIYAKVRPPKLAPQRPRRKNEPRGVTWTQLKQVTARG